MKVKKDVPDKVAEWFEKSDEGKTIDDCGELIVEWIREEYKISDPGIAMI